MINTILGAHLTQGTDEWKNLRKSRISSSDAAVLMGCHFKRKTWAQLWREKKGLVPPEPMNPAMQRGIDLEPHARQWFEEEYDCVLFPLVAFKPGYEYLMSSLDGVTIDKKYLVEIKCPGEKGMELARKGVIPDYYKAQIQFHLLVTNMETCHYVAYSPGEVYVIEVHDDPAYRGELFKRAVEFYHYLHNDICPPLEESDIVPIVVDDDVLHVVQEWAQVHDTIKALEVQEKQLRQYIIDQGDDGSFELCNSLGESVIACKRVQRESPIDWKAFMKAKGITDDDIKPFRRQTIGYYSLQRKGPPHG